MRWTITRHGWRVVSAHGWLERVQRTEPPSPVHHPQSAREVPPRTWSIVIDSADTGRQWCIDSIGSGSSDGSCY